MSSEHPFLGSGWSFPPAFARGGAAVAMVEGAEDILQSLMILLSTRPGERVMHPDFGCDLSEVLFEEIDQGLINLVTGLVSDAVIYHEPRVKLDRVEVTESEVGLLLVQVEYTVTSTNSRYNLVYPFYLHEATSSSIA